MAIDPQILLAEAKCYLCLGISQAEAVELALLARIQTAGGLGASFTSANIVVASGLTAVPHGLGSVPRYVRVVLVATAFDVGLGMQAGDEVDILPFWQSSDGFPAFNFVAGPVNITISNDGFQAGNESSIVMGGTGNNPANVNNFRFKIYAFK